MPYLLGSTTLVTTALDHPPPPPSVVSSQLLVLTAMWAAFAGVGETPWLLCSHHSDKDEEYSSKHASSWSGDSSSNNKHTNILSLLLEVTFCHLWCNFSPASLSLSLIFWVINYTAIAVMVYQYNYLRCVVCVYNNVSLSVCYRQCLSAPSIIILSIIILLWTIFPETMLL